MEQFRVWIIDPYTTCWRSPNMDDLWDFQIMFTPLVPPVVTFMIKRVKTVHLEYLRGILSLTKYPTSQIISRDLYQKFSVISNYTEPSPRHVTVD